MKKLLFITLVFILSSCSVTDQQKAESAVKDYIKEQLDDPSSYEPISFTDLKPRYDSSDRFQVGWYISHTLRAKNKFGAKIKKTYLFELDGDFSVASVL